MIYEGRLHPRHIARYAGIPVFVTEYGICDASGNGGIDEAQADAWMQVIFPAVGKYGRHLCLFALYNLALSILCRPEDVGFIISGEPGLAIQ